MNLIITQGVRDRASDIHIQPQDARVRVRYRIDGACTTCWRSRRAWARPSSAASRCWREYIVERRKPQDGQIAMEVDAAP